MSTMHGNARRPLARRVVASKARIEDAPLSGPAAFAERKSAATIAGAVGCDVRTALRALREGVDVIRTMSLREALRPHVDAWRAKASHTEERAAS